jgi:hypothetical protein
MEKPQKAQPAESSTDAGNSAEETVIHGRRFNVKRRAPGAVDENYENGDQGNTQSGSSDAEITFGRK